MPLGRLVCEGPQRLAFFVVSSRKVKARMFLILLAVTTNPFGIFAVFFGIGEFHE